MCGIFGYSGNKPDILKIKILGLYNQSRGTDACGLFLNNEVIHGNGPDKMFEDFISNVQLPNLKKNQTILGHTRKASSGGVNVNFTHPYAITDDKNKVELVGVHNGTLYNYEELGTEYGINTTNLNDSKTLFTILSKNHLDVLEKYKGNAALLMTKPSEPNTLYVFKGGSEELYHQVTHLPDIYNDNWQEQYGEDFYTHELNPNNKIRGERPLYFYQESDNSIYFSSIESSLFAIGGTDQTVFPVPVNTFLKITNGKIVEANKINRKVESFSNYYQYSTSVNRNNSYQYPPNLVIHTNNNTTVNNTTNLLIDNYNPQHDYNKVKNHIYYFYNKYFLNNSPISDGIYNVDIQTGEVDNTKITDSNFEQIAFVNSQPLILFEDFKEAVFCKHDTKILSRYTMHPIPTHTINEMYFNSTNQFDLTFEPLFDRKRKITIKNGKVTQITPVVMTLNLEDDRDEDFDCVYCIDPDKCTCKSSKTIASGYVCKDLHNVEYTKNFENSLNTLINRNWDNSQYINMKHINSLIIKQFTK